MPVTEHPPLRDLVEAMLCTVDDYGPDADTLTIHFEALRAALAARPQPDEFWLRARELARECYTPRGRKHAGPLLDYILAPTDHEAVAGSKTPMEEDTGRICPRSFASDPSQHTDPTDTEGWGRCRTCGEVVNIRGEYMPEHRWAPAGSATPTQNDG